jgi:hypothetical protein
MNRVLNYARTLKVNVFWFALGCFTILALSYAVKSEADSIVQILDRILTGPGQSLS